MATNSRFYFQAIGLAGFRVPTGNPDSQSAGIEPDGIPPTLLPDTCLVVSSLSQELRPSSLSNLGTNDAIANTNGLQSRHFQAEYSI
jgi:hypothetical protein